MKTENRIISVSLMAVLLLALSVPAFAAGNSSQKEEVVYIMADAYGSVESINIVNIFGSGDITDYGDYSAVKMLTTNDVIAQNGDMITFSTSANKSYYQGTMKDAEIPWNISIRYFIDGEEYAADDVAGKSGTLEIRFKISKNEHCKGNFYDNYALQAAFTLSTENCSNIKASGATEANVGKNKQFTYTILPGKGIDTIISTDVVDFEMSAISINGVSLNLNIEVDNMELLDKIRELMDGAVKLDDGAVELKDGAAELKTGSADLLDGAREIKSGATSLDDGIVKLQTGIDTAQSGLNTLNAQSTGLVNGSAEVKSALQTIGSSLAGVSAATDKLDQLIVASGAIKSGISNLYAGAEKLQSSIGYTQYKALTAQNGLDIDALKSGNAQAISQLSTQIGGLQDTLSKINNVSGYEQQIAELETQIRQLQEITTLLNGNNAALGGMESYLDGLSGAVGELYNGVAELKDKYEVFDAAIAELAITLSTTLADLSNLSAGINTLIANYTDLDNGIREYTEGVAQLVVGFSEIKDGVSELANGGKNLAIGSSELYDGANELYDGVIDLCEGVDKLADGTKELREKTSGMDTQAQGTIDDVLASIQADKSETASFASNMNTNVDSVQFVIKTAPIEKAETAVIETAQIENLNFWQKLLRLFGLY